MFLVVEGFISLHVTKINKITKFSWNPRNNAAL